MATKTNKKPTTNGKPLSGAWPDILTLEEAAEFLRVPASALQIEVANGRVPGRVISGEWRFSRSALLAWLDAPTPQTISGRDQLLALAGIWKDDPTVDDMIKDIYRRRKAGTVAGA
jgi:excisionase family DNA binding protein